MKYKLTIHCTEEHLKKAQYCGYAAGGNFHKDPAYSSVVNNCWIALAVQEIFPLCSVNHSAIHNNERVIARKDKKLWKISLPNSAAEEIWQFDDTPVSERLSLKPFSFGVELDQDTLNTIMECNGFRSMQQFNELIFNTPHLKMEPVFS